jgi:hypothetical protein
VVDVVDGGCDGIMHAPDDVLSDDTLQKMADQGVYYVATLSLFDALLDQEAGRWRVCRRMSTGEWKKKVPNSSQNGKMH